jgi:hypothetical protein
VTGKNEMTEPTPTPPPAPPAKPENLVLNLVCNIVLPTVVLMKFSAENRLGPLWGLILALIFPIGYGFYDLVTRKKTNVLSILGFVSVLCSGGLGLMKADGLWFAVKDAVLPTVIGLAVLVSMRTKRPLVRELFYNEQVVDIARVDAALVEHRQTEAFEALMRRTSLWLALSFIASAPVNFALARYVLRAPPGTPEFNAQLGRMHLLVWPVIVIPSMVVMMLVFWRLMTGLGRLTGLTADEIFKADKK